MLSSQRKQKRVHSVSLDEMHVLHMFDLFLFLNIFHFRLEGRILDLIMLFPGYCLISIILRAILCNHLNFYIGPWHA